MVDRYAVFGNPIAQSKSPLIHSMFAEQTQQAISYEKIEGKLNNFADSLDQFFSDPRAKGCNVTVPFKEDAAVWVTELSPAAQSAGAVNTVIRLDNGGFRGDTTDGRGLIVDLQNQDINLLNSKVLLIGAGGASRGVVLPLLDNGVTEIELVNRTECNAVKLCEWFADARLTVKTFDEINQQQSKYDLIINCTSASLHHSLPDLKDEVIARASMVYDMVYLPTDTVFVAKAKQLKVNKTSDGLGMLIGQAAYSFYLWRGVMPDMTPALAKLRAAL